ncbi:MAG TPA: hypothetical protein VGM86_03345, partial [Thermoanaerobaculia bacterium]
EQVDLPGEEAAALAATARASGYENLLRLLNQLLTSENIVRRSDTGALAVEIAWLRAAELPKLTRIEEILAGALPAVESGSARPAAAPRPAPAPAPQRRAPEPAPRPAPPSPPPAPPRAEAAPRPAPAPSRPSDPITAFKEEAARRKANLGGFLDAADDIRYEEGRASILCPQGDSYLKGRLEANRAILEEAAAAVWGAGTRVDILESRGAPKPAATEAKPAPVQQVEQIPTVQAVLDIFQGRIETVEEHGSYTED